MVEESFEKLIYAELDNRLHEVEEIIKEKGSLVPKVKHLDFFIEVGITIIFIIWWGVGIGYQNRIGGFIVSIAISLLLIWMAKKTWEILI